MELNLCETILVSLAILNILAMVIGGCEAVEIVITVLSDLIEFALMYGAGLFRG